VHKIKLYKRYVDPEYLALEQKCFGLQLLKLMKVQEKNLLKKTESKLNTLFVCVFIYSHSIVAFSTTLAMLDL
jgi:hypothetical protein